MVIFEGLYLHFDSELWRPIWANFDYRIYLQCYLYTAMQRVARRHVECGLCKTLEEAKKRVDNNDLINAKEIEQNQLDTHVILDSNSEDYIRLR